MQDNPGILQQGFTWRGYVNSICLRHRAAADFSLCAVTLISLLMPEKIFKCLLSWGPVVEDIIMKNTALNFIMLKTEMGELRS